MNSHHLREATKTEKELLISHIEKQEPAAISIAGLIKVNLENEEFGRKCPKIFVPNEALKYPIVITSASSKNEYQSLSAHWDINSIGKSKVKSLLKTLPGFDWTKSFLLYCVYLPILNMFEDLLLGEDGLAESKLYRVYKAHGKMYTCREKISYSIPDGYYCAPLTPETADLVHQYWLDNFNDSVEGIRDMIKLRPSSAAYYNKIENKKNNKCSHEIKNQGEKPETIQDVTLPVAWVIAKPNGEMGITHTMIEHRRKGLGTMVTKSLANKLLDEGKFIPRVIINCDGTSEESIAMHTKIGFRLNSDDVFGWELYLPIEFSSKHL